LLCNCEWPSYFGYVLLLQLAIAATRSRWLGPKWLCQPVGCQQNKNIVIVRTLHCRATFLKEPCTALYNWQQHVMRYMYNVHYMYCLSQVKQQIYCCCITYTSLDQVTIRYTIRCYASSKDYTLLAGFKDWYLNVIILKSIYSPGHVVRNNRIISYSTCLSNWCEWMVGFRKFSSGSLHMHCGQPDVGHAQSFLVAFR
jgi:hypothetical protein